MCSYKKSSKGCHYLTKGPFKMKVFFCDYVAHFNGLDDVMFQ